VRRNECPTSLSVYNVQVYNTALLINADCRTIDALHYIVKEFNPSVTDLTKFEDDTDKWLRQLFDGNFVLLRKPVLLLQVFNDDNNRITERISAVDRLHIPMMKKQILPHKFRK